MARNLTRNSALYAQHNYDPESLVFSMFTTDEMKKLCITKILTPLCFDAMGYPLKGGLYDKTLGPLSEKSDPCGTCFKTVTNCPGHFGYIELPLPVVNPIFHKTIQNILKITCLSCHRMQIPDNVKRMISIQLQLLDAGMVTEAKEVELTMQEIINDYREELSEELSKRLRKLEKMAKSVGAEEGCFINKTTESLRNKLSQGLLKPLVKKRCVHCKAKIEKVLNFKFKLMTNIKREDEDDKSKDESNSELKTKGNDLKLITPKESRGHFRLLWENDRESLIQIVPVLRNINLEYPTDIFYFEILPVVPTNVRPINFVDGQMVEHPQTQIYKSVVQNAMIIRAIIQIVQGGSVDSLPEEAQQVYKTTQGSSAVEKLHLMWQQLQNDIDCLMDREQSTLKKEALGLKQIIEKKAGIIRMHMMGKRVNFAARSVITPDPNLSIEEIGIPEEFAKCLTYPVPVTSWNVEELRKMVMNGPKIHPGATMVEFGNGNIARINPSNKTQQESILKRLLTPGDEEDTAFRNVKIVHRHLCNGDILLLNRQPTLHRPSIMAHTARILKGEKTIRLHYANCKAYNADFDGDEMNAHFPQNELARSEGYTLANVCNQYLVPKDGTPLSGLIQDHMVAGVRMSIRGKFFNKMDYQQLVFQAIGNKTGYIKLLTPSIIKPVELWSGKQVLSTVIINTIPSNMEAVNLTSTAKISSKAWVNSAPRSWNYGGTPLTNPNEMSEAQVIIRQGELLCGVLDKAHYGATPYGLVHCMYELYGPQYATKLLSSLAKLFTLFLQQEGFTLGVHDILVENEADDIRKNIVKECRTVGNSVALKAIKESGVKTRVEDDEISMKLEEEYVRNVRFRTIIDREYKKALDSFTNDINRTCLSSGLLCRFPENNLQLMVQSGAKGSTVNTMQISCLLGQIELEGKRPPVMISGKSLPSFVPYETSPRAGGFIDGRFMTGILPQEFFFHCMAGREGLIDTAVKTSRSGYLQRCLVKHLEGLKIGYDMTVRDSDKSVIQFFYGEDGMDVSKVQFLKPKQLSFLAENSKAIVDDGIIENLKQVDDYKNLKKYMKSVKKWKKNHKNDRKAFVNFSKSVSNRIECENPMKINPKTGRTSLTESLIELWRNSAEEIRNSFEKKTKRRPDPTNSVFQPDHYFGSMTEYLDDLIEKYEKKDSNFENTLKLKAMQSLAAPGEPVGLLAAQSIGEPSTQMTLNTFHFAGRGEMNVTLGIPRLREILMIASTNIRTPSMEIPFLDVPDVVKQAEKLRRSLTRVTVANVLEKIDVEVRLQTEPIRQYVYTLHFQFLPHEIYKDELNVKPTTILKHMTKKFFSLLFITIRKVTKISTGAVVINEEKKKINRKNDENDEEVPETQLENDDSSDEEPEGMEEDAKTQMKYKQQHEDQEPDEDDDDESEKSDNDENVKNDNSDETETKVVESYNYARNYKYDKKDNLWCELTFALPLTSSNLDLTTLLKEIATKSVIWETENIKRAITYEKDGVLTLRTDGINIQEMFKHNDLLDLKRLYSNDIHKIATTYGIEAARCVIVKEVKEVFNMYGITVDPRHLLLISDYMTYNGVFEPLSRKGMESNASPLQQMSFESSLNFLRIATVQGKSDYLASPSSCLMVGKLCTSGTGAFSLRQRIPTLVG